MDHHEFSLDQLSELSSDPAHLFMQLYDLLPESRFHDKSAQNWLDDSYVRDQADHIEIDIMERGYVDHDRMRRILTSTGDQAVFTLLYGLDGALLTVNPFSGAYRLGKLYPIGVRYAKTGYLNDPGQMPGALLPRCSFPAVPLGQHHKQDQFAVHYVPPGALLDKIDYQVLASGYDQRVSPERPMFVGCAPFLGGFDELEIMIDDASEPARYRLGPADSGRAAVARITSIIERLDDCGARIGVVPEGCLSDTLLAEWSAAARRTAGPWKSLKFLLVGSGPVGGGDPPSNRAVLIHRDSGDVIMTHDKMERFTIDLHQARRWGIPNAPDRRMEEDIRTGAKIGVLSSGLGRLAVLICEDLSTTFGWDREVAAFGVSHLLVPIFSKPIQKHHWESKAAQRLVGWLGSWVVVSNSLVVNGDDDIGGYTCVVLGPGDADRETHDVRTQYGIAPSVEDIGWVATDDGPALPAIRGGGIRLGWFGRES